MATADREMLFRAMAKLMEQRAIAIPKPGLFMELIDFHRPVDNRVSIPRQPQWEREQFPVNLNNLESIPSVTVRGFSYLVIDDGISELTEETLRSVYQEFRDIGNPSFQFIGDPTCANNAKSAYLRCAYNPCGPCEGCQDYQPGVLGGGGAL